MKINELVEGREYKMVGLERSLFKMKYGDLWQKLLNDKWEVCRASYGAFNEMEFEEVPWQPEYGERYFYPMPCCDFHDYGVWSDSEEYDAAIQRNVGVYRTREEAIAKAKELGWT